MARLTISISDERHQALKERAAITGKTIGEIIEESLERAGVKTREEALALLEKAGRNSTLSEAEGLKLAAKETRAHRRRHS